MGDWSTSKMQHMEGKMAWHVPTLTCLIKIVRHPIQWRKFLRGKWETKRCDSCCFSMIDFILDVKVWSHAKYQDNLTTSLETPAKGQISTWKLFMNVRMGDFLNLKKKQGPDLRYLRWTGNQIQRPAPKRLATKRPFHKVPLTISMVVIRSYPH